MNTAKFQRAPRQRQAGAFAVEFALFALLLFTMIFTLIEVSRALYMWNTLQEVTRRAAWAAATTNFKDAGAMAALRREAVFDANGGKLALGDPVTDQHVIIDYLALTSLGAGATAQTPISTASLPGCPERNRIICTADPNDASCIRFVRVRICEPGSNCTPVPYKTMLPLVDLPLTLPISTTILKVQSLGYAPGTAVCG